MLSLAPRKIEMWNEALTKVGGGTGQTFLVARNLWVGVSIWTHSYKVFIRFFRTRAFYSKSDKAKESEHQDADSMRNIIKSAWFQVNLMLPLLIESNNLMKNGTEDKATAGSWAGLSLDRFQGEK